MTEFCKYHRRQGAYVADCTNIETSSLDTIYSLKKTQCVIQNCMKGTNICSSRPPILTVFLRIAHSTVRQSLRDNVFVCFSVVTSKPRLFQWFFTCTVCMAEPKVNCTPSISALFTKRRVGGIYSILLSFFWSYSQHFWIKDRNKKGQVFMLSICV